MDIHWRVTTRFTDMNTWIYIGGLQQHRHEYMDIHWRVTTVEDDTRRPPYNKAGKKEERVGTRRSILSSTDFMCFLAIKVDSPVLFTYN